VITYPLPETFQLDQNYYCFGLSGQHITIVCQNIQGVLKIEWKFREAGNVDCRAKYFQKNLVRLGIWLMQPGAESREQAPHPTICSKAIRVKVYVGIWRGFDYETCPSRCRPLPAPLPRNAKDGCGVEAENQSDWTEKSVGLVSKENGG